MDTWLTDLQQVDIPVADELGHVHFMGIGGAGMSGIARIMLARGMSVSGCDAKDSRALAALRARGADIQLGHDPAHAVDADTVIASSAIRPDNAEAVEAARLGRRVLPRAAALASVMAGQRGIAVAGTAGKTTTKDVIANLLASEMPVGKTVGNLNNHFGLPLSILRAGGHRSVSRHPDAERTR